MALTEKNHTGGFIVSLANGNRSIDNGTLASGQNLTAGTILGTITTGGKLTQHAPGASDGSQNASGVLLASVDATSADMAAAYVARDAEVNTNELIWPDGITGPQKTTALGKLAALGIMVR